MKVEISLERLLIEPDGLHLLLDAELNGKTCKLVLDTGASKTVFDLTFLRAFDPELFIQKEDDESAGIGAAQLSSFTFIADEFALESLSEKGLKLAAMDLSHVSNSYAAIGAPSVQGVLGGDLLSRYNACIDYAKNVLLLQLPSAE